MAQSAGSFQAINYECKIPPLSYGQPNHKCIPFTHYDVAKTMKYCNGGTIKTLVIKEGGSEEKKTSESSAQGVEQKGNTIYSPLDGRLPALFPAGSTLNLEIIPNSKKLILMSNQTL